MQKTKLNISVGLLGAIIYFSCIFGGYSAIFILAGYVLLFEDNEWLRKTCLKAILLLITFSTLSALLNLIPNTIYIINSIVSIIGITISTSSLTTLFDAIIRAIAIIQNVIFILIGIKALNQGTLSIPFVDSLLDKYL